MKDFFPNNDRIDLRSSPSAVVAVLVTVVVVIKSIRLRRSDSLCGQKRWTVGARKDCMDKKQQTLRYDPLWNYWKRWLLVRDYSFSVLFICISDLDIVCTRKQHEDGRKVLQASQALGYDYTHMREIVIKEV